MLSIRQLGAKARRKLRHGLWLRYFQSSGAHLDTEREIRRE
jgi:hypothetical protein